MRIHKILKFILVILCIILIILYYKNIESLTNNGNKTLVLYVFHQYNDRVEHFINNCIFNDKNTDFIIISNNTQHTFIAPNYVSKLYRENIGYDFGGWSDALLTNNLYKKYKHFIFVNSSVIGPFIKIENNTKWTDIYLRELKNNVKLVGSTINTMGSPIHLSHVQSYIFCVDNITLDYLIKCEIFSTTKYATTFQDAIQNKEILMSRKIIENGWNISSLMPLYKNVDFTFINKAPSDYNIIFLGDIMYEQYRNNLWNDYEIIFIKGNRMTTI